MSDKARRPYQSFSSREAIDAERYNMKIKKVKISARPELSEEDNPQWNSRDYAKTFSTNIDIINSVVNNIERVDEKELDHCSFVEQYEKIYKPVIIIGVTETWPASKKWTIPKLAKRFRNNLFKCGEDNDGVPIGIKMKYFVHYMDNNDDDSPLYIFDNIFPEHPRTCRLLDDYEPPRYFRDDLFKYAGRHRPAYRWFLMGSPRSGTGIHIDPLGTSAWNTLISGYKRWCLFPPNTPRKLVKIDPEEGGIYVNEAVSWFNLIYPRTKTGDWPTEYKPLECIQRPRETIFVPGGWWHVVINLTNTIAVTQNFCSLTNLPGVWNKTVKSRPRFAMKWFKKLKSRRPELTDVICMIDSNQHFDVASDSEPCDSDDSSSYESSTLSSDDEDETDDRVLHGANPADETTEDQEMAYKEEAANSCKRQRSEEDEYAKKRCDNGDDNRFEKKPQTIDDDQSPK